MKFYYCALLLIIGLIACQQEDRIVKVGAINTTSSENQSNTFTNQDNEKGIRWIPVSDIEQKLNEDPKNVFFFVYTDWCESCKMMVNETFSNDSIIQLINEHFYAVKWDAESIDSIQFRDKVYKNKHAHSMIKKKSATHQFSFEIATINNQIKYPTFSFYTPKLRPLFRHSSFIKQDDFLKMIHYIQSNKWKDGIEYTTFLNNFKENE